jgi:hypothetical protein
LAANPFTYLSSLLPASESERQEAATPVRCTQTQRQPPANRRSQRRASAHVSAPRVVHVDPVLATRYTVAIAVVYLFSLLLGVPATYSSFLQKNMSVSPFRALAGCHAMLLLLGFCDVQARHSIGRRRLPFAADCGTTTIGMATSGKRL